MEKLQRKFIDKLVNYTIEHLSGETEEFDFITDFKKPENNEVILGTLSYEDKDSLLKSTTKIQTSSMSIKFLTSSSDKILVIVSFSLYYYSYPSFIETIQQILKNTKFHQQVDITDLDNCIQVIQEEFNSTDEIPLKKGWRRIRVKNLEIILSLAKNDEVILELSEYIEKISHDNLSTGQGKFQDRNDFTLCVKDIQNEQTYQEFVDKNRDTLPSFNWQVSLSTILDKYPQGDDLNQITITLRNLTDIDNSYDTVVFNSKLNINFNNVIIENYEFPYRYEGFDRMYFSKVQSVNCEAVYHENENCIETRYHSCYEQPIIKPKTDVDTKSGSIELKFKDLATSGTNIELLVNLNEALENHYNNYRDNKEYTEDSRFKFLTDNFEKQKRRINEGIELLKTNEVARKAFELMNETFYQANIGKYDRWRVFQLCFILIVIPDIVRTDKNREITEILHVQTGGGKSETYFGCVILAAFWDRLNGKEFGVTGITKFPLRMLSIQQLQRISEIMIVAEEVRKNNKIAGSEFSTGYFVGRSEDYPDNNFNLIREIIRKKSNNEFLPGKMIQNCPICKTGDVILEADEEKRLVYHKCASCQRIYYQYFTSEEVYRMLPTFIVSTVDKHAAVATNRRYKNLIGGKIDLCPKHGYFPRKDKCTCQIPSKQPTKGTDCANKQGEKVDLSFSTAPTLIVQDEMHLIKESFGTIDSHFETLIEGMIEKFSGNSVKNIAMTATITGADHQIKELYCKDSSLFPSTSPFERGNEDFFFNLETSNGENKIERLLIGVRPNFRDNQFACLLTLKYFLKFIDLIENNEDQFAQEFDTSGEELNTILALYKSILTYHGKKSDVHSMEYLLPDVVNADFADKNVKVVGYPLTGDSTLDQIREHISLIENKDLTNKSELLATFATSVVSHGVDIENWNLLLFQGIPRSTAEYIQVLSRVGRKNLGVVFIWFYGTRVRDISFYQNFNNYHDILEHHIDKVPISRWAKLGICQSFHSIFCGSILNYFSNVIEEPIYHVSKVNDVFSDKENVKKLIDFIRHAYDIPENIADPFLDKFIPKEVERRLKDLLEYTGEDSKYYFPFALESFMKPYYKTQFGLRGIQNKVAIQPVYRERNFVKSFKNEGEYYE